MRFVYSIMEIFPDKSADILIAIIGLVSACIVAIIGLFGSALTLVLNKRHERKVELRKIKESQYIDFLGSLAEAKIAKEDERYKINRLLSARVQTIYLIGSEEVQKALSAFFEIFSVEKIEPNKQDILYATLVEAMKKDLYGKKSKSLESISFTVFGD
ncbi:MAG: hypothetical protein NC420_14990 [Eubacterium sp.]|nr:hypothetical protein [Eubacterium sp.]MCM1411625.1 hypothetical protein [Lachnospiraceae bacterium]